MDLPSILSRRVSPGGVSTIIIVGKFAVIDDDRTDRRANQQSIKQKFAQLCQVNDSGDGGAGVESVHRVGCSSLLLLTLALVGLQHSHCLLNLALERVLVLKHVDKLSVVDLKQHAGDLAGEVGEHALDEREQPLAKHLLLLLRRGRSKHRGSQMLLALDEHCLLGWRSSSWSHHLSRHHLGWRVASSWRVLEALLRTHLGSNHRHWRHAWPGHHGHWLRSGLVHRPWLLLTNSRSSHPGSAGSNTTSHTHSSHAHAGHTAGPWHCLLLWPAGLGTDLGRSEEALGLGHRGHEVASHAHLLHAAHLLHPHASHPLDVLGSQVSLPVLLSLCEGNIERLGNDDPSVHLSDGLGRLLGRREANKTEAFAPALFVHHLGAGDRPIGSKLLPQPLVVDGIIKVLDVEVDALVPVQPLQLQLLKLLLQLLLTLGLLLGSPDVQGLAEHLDSVELVHGFLSRLAVFKGDKSEAFVLSVRSGLHDVLTFLALDIPILHHFVGGDLAKLGEHFLEFLVSKVLSEVLDVHVGELLGLLSQLLLPLLAGHKPPHKDLLLVEQHAVDLLDGVHGGLLR